MSERPNERGHRRQVHVLSFVVSVSDVQWNMGFSTYYVQNSASDCKKCVLALLPGTGRGRVLLSKTSRAVEDESHVEVVNGQLPSALFVGAHLENH